MYGTCHKQLMEIRQIPKNFAADSTKVLHTKPCTICTMSAEYLYNVSGTSVLCPRNAHVLYMGQMYHNSENFCCYNIFMVGSNHENFPHEIFLTTRIMMHGYANSCRGEMALLQYLQHKDRLPDPKGSLSFTIPPQAIARANQEVQAAAKKEVQVRERRENEAHTTDTAPESALTLEGTLLSMPWL